MKNLSARKNIRLKDYDYSQNGAYFITICTQDGHDLLGKIDVGANCVRPILSEIGQIVENEMTVLSNPYEDVIVDKYIVMPNHIHMIIFISTESGRTQFAPTVSRIIKQFKGSISKQIGDSIWQKSFHDHIIRDERDYKIIWNYIDSNPAKWVEDKYYENKPLATHNF